MFAQSFTDYEPKNIPDAGKVVKQIILAFTKATRDGSLSQKRMVVDWDSPPLITGYEDFAFFLSFDLCSLALVLLLFSVLFFLLVISPNFPFGLTQVLT